MFSQWKLLSAAMVGMFGVGVAVCRLDARTAGSTTSSIGGDKHRLSTPTVVEAAAGANRAADAAESEVLRGRIEQMERQLSLLTRQAARAGQPQKSEHESPHRPSPEGIKQADSFLPWLVPHRSAGCALSVATVRRTTARNVRENA